MSICNRLDLQTLESQPVIMPKNLPDYCCSFGLSPMIVGLWANANYSVRLGPFFCDACWDPLSVGFQ